MQLKALNKTIWVVDGKNGGGGWRRVTFKQGKENSGRMRERDLRRQAFITLNWDEIQRLMKEGK
jgi:hypothetical protein